jgi:4-diphosphocytidyl-2C-methyl-D-erythritol kinase
MKTYSIDNLTEEQLRLITETLLFASSVDVNANWYYENYQNMFDMALSIRKKYPNILLKNTFIIKEQYENEFSERLVNYFPEIEKESDQLLKV